MDIFRLPPRSHCFHVIMCPSSPVCACRIYNKLPEVAKKKEEERKRLVSETNRLRAEVFKKVKLYLTQNIFVFFAL